VRVPNVIGDKANAAAARLEEASLQASFKPEPDNADLCRVRRQRARGEVAEGRTVALTLRCEVVVPNVTGSQLGDATRRLDGVGHIKVTWGGQSSDHPNQCTVTSQSQRGKVAPGTEVVLLADCPITTSQVSSEARSLAHKSAVEDGGDYAVSNCQVVGTNQGTCDVRYFDDPTGIECTATIVVDDEGDTLRTHQEDVACY
jgi:hypothetical protein